MMDDGVKFPGVTVKLVGRDGNAHAILAAVRQGLRQAHVSKEDIDEFLRQAMASDYMNLLATCQRWVNVT